MPSRWLLRNDGRDGDTSRDELYTVETPLIQHLAKLNIQKEKSRWREVCNNAHCETIDHIQKLPSRTSSPYKLDNTLAELTTPSDNSVYLRKYARLQSITNSFNNEDTNGLSNSKETVKRAFANLEEYINTVCDYQPPNEIETTTHLPQVPRSGNATSRDSQLNVIVSDSSINAEQRANSSSAKVTRNQSHRNTTSPANRSTSRSESQRIRRLSGRELSRPITTGGNDSTAIIPTASRAVLPRANAKTRQNTGGDDGRYTMSMQQTVLNYFSPQSESPQSLQSTEFENNSQGVSIGNESKVNISWPVRRQVPILAATSRLQEARRQRQQHRRKEVLQSVAKRTTTTTTTTKSIETNRPITDKHSMIIANEYSNVLAKSMITNASSIQLEMNNKMLPTKLHSLMNQLSSPSLKLKSPTELKSKEVNVKSKSELCNESKLCRVSEVITSNGRRRKRRKKSLMISKRNQTRQNYTNYVNHNNLMLSKIHYDSNQFTSGVGIPIIEEGSPDRTSKKYGAWFIEPEKWDDLQRRRAHEDSNGESRYSKVQKYKSNSVLQEGDLFLSSSKLSTLPPLVVPTRIDWPKIKGPRGRPSCIPTEGHSSNVRELLRKLEVMATTSRMEFNALETRYGFNGASGNNRSSLDRPSISVSNNSAYAGTNISAATGNRL